ncbi:MAG TPA: hypothetical protein ENN69_01930 [Spirochaetia bacterium]|nr:hypothetical protein [Spirochaetia bacterium]
MLFESPVNTAIPRARRAAIVLGGLLGLFLIVSVVVYLITPQWAKRVLFFPEVNTHRFVAEIRYLPPADNAADDIRLLLEDILLGPSNFGNGPVVSPQTTLVSSMLEDDVLYAGFSRGIFNTPAGPIAARERLQAIADAVFFNFPWVKKIYFFIDGAELTDGPIRQRLEMRNVFARALIGTLDDLPASLRLLSTHPFASSAAGDRNLYLFQNGVEWDPRPLK